MSRRTNGTNRVAAMTCGSRYTGYGKRKKKKVANLQQLSDQINKKIHM